MRILFGMFLLRFPLGMREALTPVPLDHRLDDEVEEKCDAGGRQQGGNGEPEGMHDHSGFTVGKRMTSRIGLPVSSMTRRSTPMPVPPIGGAPYSSARRKSSSSCIASGSPPAASSDCCVRRSRWMTGSTSSL